MENTNNIKDNLKENIKKIPLMDNSRNSNMELLRIIAAFLVVMYHYAVYGGIGYTSYYSKDLLNGLFAQFLSMGGNIGGMLFIAISGYYQSQKDFSTEHLLKILCQVFFYSVLIYLVFCITGSVKFNFWIFLRSLFPFFFDQWFFVTAYVAIYCLSPFINKFLNVLEEEDFKKLLLTECVLWLLLPTILGFFGGTTFYGNVFVVYITVYTAGAYIRRFGSKQGLSEKCKKVLIISVIVILASALLFDILGEHISIFFRKGVYFASINSVFAFATVFCLIQLASSSAPKSNQAVNNVAATALGVYLLCSHAYTRDLIFKRIIKAPEQIKSVLFIVFALLCCIGVYAACVVIDYLRRFLLEKNMSGFFKKTADKINSFATSGAKKLDNEL